MGRVAGRGRCSRMGRQAHMSGRGCCQRLLSGLELFVSAPIPCLFSVSVSVIFSVQHKWQADSPRNAIQALYYFLPIIKPAVET